MKVSKFIRLSLSPPARRANSVVRAAFAQRRKTLLNALSASYGSRFSKEQLRQIILDLGLPETIRGERLGLEKFAQLAKALQ